MVLIDRIRRIERELGLPPAANVVQTIRAAHHQLGTQPHGSLQEQVDVIYERLGCNRDIITETLDTVQSIFSGGVFTCGLSRSKGQQQSVDDQHFNLEGSQHFTKVKKAIPPMSLWKFFLMLVACSFAASSHFASYANDLLPEIIAIIAPERAGETALYVISAFFLCGVTTLYWGHLADEWKDFRGLFLGLNVLLAVCSGATWFLFHYRVVLSTLALPMFAVLSTLIGTACIGVVNMTFNLCAVYALSYPEFSTTFASMVSTREARNKARAKRVLLLILPVCLCLYRAVLHASGALLTDGMRTRTQVTVVFALGAIGGMMLIVALPLSPEDDSLLVALPAMAILNIVTVLCTPASMHRPHELLDDDDEEDMSQSALNPTGLVLLDCLVAFASEEYQPLLLVTMAGSLCGSIPGLMPSVVQYFDEDHTSIGADASAFKANVNSAFYCVLLFIAVPAGRWLDGVRRPMEAFAMCMLLAAVMIACTLLSKEYSPYWSMVGILGMNFTYAAQNFLLIPSFLECVTNVRTLSRDVNFMFAVIAVFQTALPLGISPIYEWFDSTTISGRERPAYAFAAYIVILGGFALIVLTAGILLKVARCLLQTLITNRVQHMVDKVAFEVPALYSSILAPWRHSIIKRQIESEIARSRQLPGGAPLV